MALLLCASGTACLAGEAPARAGSPRASLSLAGEWRFRLDPKREGGKGKWFATTLPHACRLPGTTDENGYGEKNKVRETGHLSRLVRYTGPAWYQRDVEIPRAWLGRRITLLLERSKETRVWVDDKALGSRNSYSTPHVYDLTAALTPGRHVLTVCVDNAVKLPIGAPHAVSEHTQTNWNGILGRIELVATDRAWLDRVRVLPQVGLRRAFVDIVVGKAVAEPIRGEIAVRARSWNGKRTHVVPARIARFETTESLSSQSTLLRMGDEPLPWDEFSPNLYRLTVSLAATDGDASYRDELHADFGMRDVHTLGGRLWVNGRRLFLRGNTDSCVFPLTGYAPMDVAAWARVFRIARSYGINHYRFHTWCPPEAAFAAADQAGIYLQPELPNWRAFGDARHDQYMQAEAERILDAYGTHPSFAMFALGSELTGRRDVMARLVQRLRLRDPRHLYAQGSNNFHAAPSLAKGDDFWTTMWTQGKWDAAKPGTGGAFVRGSFAHPARGHVNNQPPSTLADYRKAIAGMPVPVIAHEVGQYQVFPNFREIPKYTGVLRPRNLEAFRERLQAKGMVDQADAFHTASGKLAVLCYREEIEAALRTPGLGGFQLLGLQDYPGQGTALVGILDAFLDPKGLITPRAWRRFCAPTVPLVRMAKHTWTADETFTAQAQVAHYGPASPETVVPAWSLREAGGLLLAAGTLPRTDVPQGEVLSLGTITAPLADVRPPAKLTLELSLRGPDLASRYPLWVYPPEVDTTPPDGIVVARRWDKQTRAALADGKSVLLLPRLDRLENCVGGAFQPDFRSYAMFRKFDPPGTLGILCDPNHPALARFPTEFHSNWQWWHLARRARPIILDEAPADYRPIVQAIDNVERTHKLGILFEARVGQGKLLVCSTDLTNGLENRPAARQLLHSLLAYMGSPHFMPRHRLGRMLLARLLAEKRIDLALGKPAKASGAQSAKHVAARGNDGRPNTRWCAADAKAGHWWQVDLQKPHDIVGCEVRWEFDGRKYRYRIDGSADGKTWRLLVDRRRNRSLAQVQTHDFEAKGIRHVRLTIAGLPKRPPAWASFYEFRVFGEAPGE